VDHYPWNVPNFQTDPQAKTYPFAYSPDEIPDLAPSIARGYPDPDGEIDRWVRKFRSAPVALVRRQQSSVRPAYVVLTSRDASQGRKPVSIIEMADQGLRDIPALRDDALAFLQHGPPSDSRNLHSAIAWWRVLDPRTGVTREGAMEAGVRRGVS